MLNSSKKKKLLWIFFAISVLFNGIALVFLGGMLYKADLRDKTDVPYKADSSTPFQDKKIAFLGDSITYGFDPDNKGKQMKNPWVKQVGEKLQAQECLNYGVNSASVMDIKGTRMAAIGAYKQMNKDVDILGVMIGINDAYRKYPLGMFTDRTPDTFYGSLHLMWRGILKQYPPSSGKKVFFIMYPRYDVLPFWPAYQQALYEVADFYSIPICDLGKELGISPDADDTYTYWPEETYAGKAGRAQRTPNAKRRQSVCGCHLELYTQAIWVQRGI